MFIILIVQKFFWLKILYFYIIFHWIANAKLSKSLSYYSAYSSFSSKDNNKRVYLKKLNMVKFKNDSLI